MCYIPCKDVEQAKSIGQHLLKNKVAACINIYPEMNSFFFWPPKSNKIDEGHEAVLIAKTIEYNYKALEDEVLKVHSYDTPCVIALPTAHVNQKYYDWLVGELK